MELYLMPDKIPFSTPNYSPPTDPEPNSEGGMQNPDEENRPQYEPKPTPEPQQAPAPNKEEVQGRSKL